MKLNLIVKDKWLLLPSLRQKEAADAAAKVLRGEAPRPANLEPEELAYLEEKAIQVSGNPARLLAKLEKLPDSPPKHKRELWEERLFLKGFALSRLGREAASGDLFARLPSRFRPRIQTERALTFVNRGALIEAELHFLDALGQTPELDPFSACTLLGGLSLALIHQGKFAEAEKCLRERRSILRAHPSPTLLFGTSLYEILLALEHNRFDQADDLLRRALVSVEKVSVNGFFLLHLKLRLALARNELEEAGDLLAELKSNITHLQLPQGVLDLRVEEIEWHLRCRRPPEARKIAVALETELETKRDDQLRFRLKFLLGLTLWQEGKASQGVAEIEAAIALAEARHYYPNLSWAFFHAAGIALSAGQPVRAKLFLGRGRRLAEELRLPVRLAAFSYIAEVLEDRHASASSLVSLAKHQEIGPELEYFLSAYQILNSVAVEVSQGGMQERVEEPELRRKLFREPGVFWFQREAVLVANKGQNRVSHLDLSSQEHQLLLFRLFWNAGEKGLRLEDVHHARLSTPFREHLHGGAAKMAISRLRSQLKPCGLELEYSRSLGRYLLIPHGPAYTIQSTSATGKRGSGREEEILQRIAMESFVATQTLCEEFGVSRQALHPALKRLCAQNKLKLVRRGPISGYVYRR